MYEPAPRPLPEWAQRERIQDLAWIGENLHLFWPAAQEGFQKAGRGAIVTDTTTLVKHEGGKSHPYLYLPLSAFEDSRHDDLFSPEDLRLIHEYQPEWEFVAVLLKEGRESAYRLRIPDPRD